MLRARISRHSWAGEEARAIEDGNLRRIHYEIHDGGDAFFLSCREGSDQHQWRPTGRVL